MGNPDAADPEGRIEVHPFMSDKQKTETDHKFDSNTENKTKSKVVNETQKEK